MSQCRRIRTALCVAATCVIVAQLSAGDEEKKQSAQSATTTALTLHARQPADAPQRELKMRAFTDRERQWISHMLRNCNAFPRQVEAAGPLSELSFSQEQALAVQPPTRRLGAYYSASFPYCVPCRMSSSRASRLPAQKSSGEVLGNFSRIVFPGQHTRKASLVLDPETYLPIAFQGVDSADPTVIVWRHEGIFSWATGASPVAIPLSNFTPTERRALQSVVANMLIERCLQAIEQIITRPAAMRDFQNQRRSPESFC